MSRKLSPRRILITTGSLSALCFGIVGFGFVSGGLPLPGVMVTIFDPPVASTNATAGFASIDNEPQARVTGSGNSAAMQGFNMEATIGSGPSVADRAAKVMNQALAGAHATTDAHPGFDAVNDAPPPVRQMAAEPQFAERDATSPPRPWPPFRPSGVVQPEVMAPDVMASQVPDGTEAFASAEPNPLVVTAEQPVSTFSIDVDTASYAVVRSRLNGGMMPPKEAVRVEEMINYFPYAYPAPLAGEAPFLPGFTVMPSPWNPGTELVHIGLQGRMPEIADRPPLNLVFLVDTSGSMNDAAKLPLLKQSLRLLLGQLRSDDQIAIVSYAGSAGVVLPPTAAADRTQIEQAIGSLQSGGSTAGADGLQLAYATAAGMAGDGEVSRVLLATDGDFNVGISDPSQLKDFIAAKRDSGIFLSVLGFGRGNLDDATMQALAQNGNGQAAYIDTLSEARKVLVDQLAGELFPIASDVKIQVEWNPATVAEYRLIGYETRALKREDFANDRVDAGEIGAGHTVTAIYEVTPVGSPARRNEPLRYGQEPVTEPSPTAAPAHGDELGFLRLRYKEPGARTSQLMELPIRTQAGVASADVRFGVAMAGFGQLLRGSEYLGTWGWNEAIALAEGARGEDPFGYRIEAVNLMRLAQSLGR
ncbi:vWA domain-containing protein [Cereibacter sphaeroides]|uniref:vWA domain-containing protein n=1 Tax=Cereibacter sphaeroides TaxID=1063 RepID=UPI003AF0A254